MAELNISATAVDITNCDLEPIHIPGAILPHGAMLVLDAVTLEILQVAGDTLGLLGVPLDGLIGQTIATVFGAAQVEALRSLTAGFELLKPRHLLDPLLRIFADRPLDASLHRCDGLLILEFEAADLADRFVADPLAAVHEMVQGFDEAASTYALCQLAVQRVRDVAQYDRVMIYRFMQDGSGWVIAESAADHLEPFLDLHYPAADIPQQARTLYLKNALRLITQVDYEPAPLTPTLNPRTGLPLDMSQAILRDVSPIHREYLRNMGIDASMSISIIYGGQLWGLIACHHYRPRVLPRHLRAVCELFGAMFSLQLEGRQKGEQFEERLASRMILQNLMLNLASADDYAAGLTQQSPNLLDYIQCGDSAGTGPRQGGVAVSVKGRLTFLGSTPAEGQIIDLISWLSINMKERSGVFSTDRLGEIWPDAAAFAETASGVLVISVSPDPGDFIIWFRPELLTTVNWAGEPTKLSQSSPDGERLSPRKSFEAWKATVRGRCLPWTTADLDAAFDLRVSLLHVVLRRINAAAGERKRAAAHDKLLMAELDHRVKNTIANIQALVVQTSRSADTLTGFVEGLDGRIQSMAKAHSLLSQSRWEGVSIDLLLHEELDHYSGDHSSVVLNGPEALLTPKSALSLSLAIHELATNAAKFGSLSRPDGRVAVTWRLAPDHSIELSWCETGGPMVEPPTRRGFGSTLIERALAMETGGRANIHYLRSGVVCDVFLPASSIAPRDASADPQPKEAPAVTAPVVKGVPEAFHILVVEDSFLLVTLIEDMFDDFGWKIVGPATTKAEALVLAETASFDAALLDINLNGELSWDVAVALKERGIPFVFSTGYDTETALPDHLAGSPVMGKPFRRNHLEQRLRKAIVDKRGG